jgi:cob(I)alamin adenosyltransferase
VKIYTKTGDRGETKLYGGRKVPKHDARVEAYGTVDELNATIGLALAFDGDGALDAQELVRVQSDLFTIGAALAAADPEAARKAGTIPELSPERIEALEAWIDRLDAGLEPLDAFILPGGSPAGAHLHAARTVCRRAERAVTRLLADRPDLADGIVPYMNRLSDLLFTLARSVNAETGATEARWEPMRRRNDEE